MFVYLQVQIVSRVFIISNSINEYKPSGFVFIPLPTGNSLAFIIWERYNERLPNGQLAFVQTHTITDVLITMY